MRDILLNGRNMVRFLCALALVLIAFAHKPIDLGPGNGYDLAVYTLPDGTVPILCLPSGDDDDHGGHDNHFYGQGCEACRISSAIDCPVPPKASGPTIIAGEIVARVAVVPVIRRDSYPPSAPPQAPPFV
ncbi:hypothetical protein GCM10011491_15630 [Brucella endophytica]|uniref:DUF2946 domain-containing protein n=1 Tax=Brucella endophytica TaxID=1963359 RepID=A0A916WDG5_9HYPH|nr:hypothetical protein [Brucella endophytica]GGA88701.1 hypothetical protein GCM10011491_15630 [Brucella endophytica]